MAHSSVAERPAYTRPAAVRFRLRRPVFAEGFGWHANAAIVRFCLPKLQRRRAIHGEVAERLKALVPKTRGPRGSVGSNPTLSASLQAR